MLVSLDGCAFLADRRLTDPPTVRRDRVAFSLLKRHIPRQLKERRIADRQKPQWKEFARNEERTGRTKVAWESRLPPSHTWQFDSSGKHNLLVWIHL